jgi:hypothetical protein
VGMSEYKRWEGGYVPRPRRPARRHLLVIAQPVHPSSSSWPSLLAVTALLLLLLLLLPRDVGIIYFLNNQHSHAQLAQLVGASFYNGRKVPSSTPAVNTCFYI